MPPLQLLNWPTYNLPDIQTFVKRESPHQDSDLIIWLYYAITNELAARPGYPRLNPVPFIFQAMHETGYLTSWWLIKNRNLAGLGVTGVTRPGSPDKKPAPVPGTDWSWNSNVNQWVQGLIFFDWPPAVYAHIYHALAYVIPGLDYGPVAQFFNNRYPLALAARKGKPGAKVLTDLNGAWAVPGHDYGQRIEAIHTDFKLWLTRA